MDDDTNDQYYNNNLANSMGFMSQSINSQNQSQLNVLQNTHVSIDINDSA